jgi:hypothetical protein
LVVPETILKGAHPSMTSSSKYIGMDVHKEGAADKAEDLAR